MHPEELNIEDCPITIPVSVPITVLVIPTPASTIGADRIHNIKLIVIIEIVALNFLLISFLPLLWLKSVIFFLNHYYLRI